MPTLPRPSARSNRGPAWEWRAAAWACRHPLMVATPTAAGLATYEYGPTLTGSTILGGAAALGAWYRGHPATFDPIVGARLRASRRRWTAYNGHRWADILADCDLVRETRRKGQVRVPRVIKVISPTPSIDTVYVDMVRGQTEKQYTEAADALADAFRVHRVACTRVKPGVIAITIERRNPFDPEPITAAEIPETVEEIDFRALPLGEDEYGNDWTLRLLGQHFLGVGATGAGKSGLMWNPLRAMGPAIREGIVRVYMLDLKGGVETSLAEPLFYRHATEPKGALDVVTEFRDDMKAKQKLLRETKQRKTTPTRETPFNVLMIDEFAMLSLDSRTMRDFMAPLTEVLTQGRATCDSVCAYLQEARKDVVPVRDLFTTRACLRVTDDSHVNMTLGDKARERGALADLIPLDEEHVGHGYVIAGRSQTPRRVRAAMTTDEDIAELVRTCAPTPPAPDAEVIPIRKEGAA